MRRDILQKILGFLTKRIVKKYRPKVIAITGSVGKTSTKNAITLLLERYLSVWGGSGNLNTEFGVPLAFIGKKKGGGSSFKEWMKIITSGFGLILVRKRDYPKVIVAEMGADKPGDISYLTGLVKPDISVVTMIGEMPVHLENYGSVDEVVDEKAKIVEKLEEKDFAILNFDDPAIKKMKERTKAKVVYFGFGEGADLRIDDFTFETKVAGGKEMPYGVSFKLSFEDDSWRIHLPYCLGRPFSYSVATAFACGMAMGLDMDRAPDIFREMKPEDGRMNLIETDDLFVIDDSYNASPASTRSALETLRDLPGSRRVAILGDMKELGVDSAKAHEDIGEMAAGICDVIVTVGDLAENIKDGATVSGMSIGNAIHCKTNEEVASKLKNLLSSGDLVLVKGSRSMKMEEVVKKITE